MSTPLASPASLHIAASHVLERGLALLLEQCSGDPATAAEPAAGATLSPAADSSCPARLLSATEDQLIALEPMATPPPTPQSSTPKSALTAALQKQAGANLAAEAAAIAEALAAALAAEQAAALAQFNLVQEMAVPAATAS